MKLTRDKLKKIIKEELSEMMSENQQQFDSIKKRNSLMLATVRNEINAIEDKMKRGDLTREEHEQLSDILKKLQQNLEYDEIAASNEKNAMEQGPDAYRDYLMKTPPGK